MEEKDIVQVNEDFEYQGIHFVNFEDKNAILQLFQPAQEGKRQEGKVLHKYMSFDDALRVLKNKKLWFANPCTWDDPLEKEYLTKPFMISGKPQFLPWKDNVYITCLSRNATSEALWKNHAKLRYCTLNFTFYAPKLLELLLHYTSDFDVYIGNVKYVPVSTLKQKLSKISFLSSVIASWADPLWARMLMLKRNAFRYEDEVRIMLVRKEKQTIPCCQDKGMAIAYNIVPSVKEEDLLQTIYLDPNLPDEVVDFYKKSLCDCTTCKNIKPSRLYQSLKRTFIQYS